MADIKLYIAQSLDGYIARKDGNLDWLTEFPVPEGVDYGYGDFIKDIDVVVMGSGTYNEILGFDVPWPYGDCKTFVFTSRKGVEATTPDTKFVNGLTEQVVAEIKASSSKHVWIVGGGNLIKQFLAFGAIDEILISTVPVLIGDGIPLFPAQEKTVELELIKTEQFETGMLNTVYRVKR